MPNPNGVVAGNDQNIPEAHVPRTRSTFPLHRLFPNTHRFGEYIPHYVEDLNKDERFPIHSSGQVRSYTFKSPLLQSVSRNKDYFLVPMEAILPLNWEKFFDNPVIGDDVPDDVGPCVENFWNKAGTAMQAIGTVLDGILQDSTTVSAVTIMAFFRYLVLGEYFYSNGNLLASLGCHGSPYCLVSGGSGTYQYDDYFDAGISTFISEVTALVSTVPGVVNIDAWFTLNVDGFSYRVNLEGKSDTSNYYFISLRHALQLMRDNPTFTISNVNTRITNGLTTLKANLYSKWFDAFTVTFCKYNVDCNLDRVWAYQLCISHYMTNDHIDYVYSAELFRQLIGNYIFNCTHSSFSASSKVFSRNGITYQYDFLSAHFCDLWLSYASGSAAAQSILTATTVGNSWYFLGYFSALFGYRRSLRYLDYFTGSRANPTAVVNTGGYTSSGNGVISPSLSVLDITRSIQAQRFLNSVNRVRHSFESYLKGIFGGKMPAPDYHNPFYVAHSSDVIFGQETENTATEQMTDKIAVTTNLRSASDRYAFDVESDRPCIIIGITSYDIPRVYQSSMDRSFLRRDRFAWFNPFMQYIGDQPIWLQELGINPNGGLSALKTFSYTLRHMEYKQKFNTCAGAFCNPTTDLDLWIFGAKDKRGDQDVINPDWIRSLNAEFDQFYVSLSGWSLGTYFHFIVADYNTVNASRPMAYAPQILG